MQVHDELVLEVRKDAVERVTEAVRGCMVVAGQGALRVPLKVDVGRGTNWDEAH
jgi:DNA polymerase-1